MANEPDRITIVAKEFTAAALEYHRGRMGEKGYMMEGPITARAFKVIEGMNPPAELFDGDELYAATFVKLDAK
ncbi:MAG: AMP nucleosidase [Pseudomonadota bacterium]